MPLAGFVRGGAGGHQWQQIQGVQQQPAPLHAGAVARVARGEIEARIEEYLAELDARDAQAEGVPAAPGRLVLAEKIALLRERKGRYDGLLGEPKRTCVS